MAERRIDYEVLEKTDTGFLVRAPSLQRLYIDAALAMTDILTKLDRIGDYECRKISVSADCRENKPLTPQKLEMGDLALPEPHFYARVLLST